MLVESIYLKEVFGEDISLEVPFFQRKYVWNEDNWDDMWEGVKSLYLDKNKQEYFMGNIIIKHKESSHRKREYEIIDGQQRLVTLSILLKVIANLCDNPVLKEEINNSIKFEDSKDKSVGRIRCNITDRECYEELMNNDDGQLAFLINDYGKEHRIIRCYSFFKERIKEDEELEQRKLKGGEDKFKILSKILLGEIECLDIREGTGNISFVRIGLTEQDDEQEIFDTLNSSGKALSLADLVKNYLFREQYFEDDRGTLKEKHKEFWKDIFEGDNLEWWERQVFKQGRNSKNNLELFLFCYVIIKAKRYGSDIIKSSEIYREYKKIIDDAVKKGEIQELLNELREYAEIYRDNFKAGEKVENLNHKDWNRRLFLLLDLNRNTSIHPLVLYYYHKKNGNEQDKQKFAEEIMSYLLRRSACKLTGKNYNKLFNDAVYRMNEENIEFSEFIKTFEKDTRTFPDDKRFSSALLISSSINSKDWKFILCSIEALIRSKNPKGDMDSVGYDGKVEYIIPQGWENTKWYQKSMETDVIVKQDSRIKTLGNVAVVSASWKSSWTKEIWAQKRVYLGESESLPMMNGYLEEDKWNRDTIEQRAKELVALALEIWPDILKK